MTNEELQAVIVLLQGALRPPVPLGAYIGPLTADGRYPRCIHGQLMPTREHPGEPCELCEGKGPAADVGPMGAAFPVNREAPADGIDEPLD